ncbi:MAG TPA: hypothetical protein VF519_07095 [Mycobacteriales bacterium]|jgi:hypothetical protein
MVTTLRRWAYRLGPLAPLALLLLAACGGPDGGEVPGRPLRRRGTLLLPEVAGAAAPAPAAAPDVAALWLRAARGEHASVPAFAEVALQLSAAGAPLDLVAAAHRAALDEVAHTELTYALANAAGGTAYAPGALPRLARRRVGPRRRVALLRRLALDALRDGCLNEGHAAALAAAGAASATDAGVRAALTRIAADEARHAELAWRVLGWALDAGGRPVAGAVAYAVRALPLRIDPATPRADLEAYGWPSPATSAAAYADVRAAVVARANGLLSLSAA